MKQIHNTNEAGINIKKKFLAGDSTVQCFALKFYDEQLPYGFEALVEAIKRADSNSVQILCIKHDKDIVVEDYWNSPREKPHYHVIVRIIKRMASGRVYTPKLSTALNQHLGGTVVYRNPEDKDMIENHGIEACGDFSAYALYLTHETQSAIKAGKYRYELEDIVSNLTMDEIKEVRNGYRLLGSKRLSDDVIEVKEKEAYELGYALGDFDNWFFNLPFSIRKHNSRNLLKETFSIGADRRVEEDSYTTRVCIFLYGESNIGKSYSSEIALKKIGFKNVKDISNQGTGKFDDVTLRTDALILSDDTSLSCMESLMDNKIVKLPRRNSNNPYFKGKFVIVTANCTFETWLQKSGIPQDQWKAVKSRMFIFRVSDDDDDISLECEHGSKRGTSDDTIERLQLCKRFIDELGTQMKMYKDERKNSIELLDAIDFNDFFNKKVDSYDFDEWDFYCDAESKKMRNDIDGIYSIECD